VAPGWYVGVAVVAAAVTYLAMFPIRATAARIGFVAAPDERRVHSRPTPYGGGLAMWLAVVAAMGVAWALPAFRPVFSGSTEPLGVVLAGTVILVVGLVDDARDMSAPAKVAGQVLAASVLVLLGVTMFQFKIPLAGFFVLSPSVTPLLTAVWVIVITNAVNLIDGLDGLAAGIVAIASAALTVYGLRLVHLGQLPTDNLGPLVAAVTCGACLGFLPHNVHPAKAFMGDAGALLLGLLMAAATMVVGGRTPDVVSGQTYFFFAPLFIPVFILGVPIADMAFAFVRRTARRQGFQTPDKDHVHHRLLRLGHGHRRTVVILWAWTVALSGFVLFPLFDPSGNAIIPFGAVVLGLLLYTFFHPGLRKAADDIDSPLPVPDDPERVELVQVEARVDQVTTEARADQVSADARAGQVPVDARRADQAPAAAPAVGRPVDAPAPVGAVGPRDDGGAVAEPVPGRWARAGSPAEWPTEPLQRVGDPR
jgi:UDP-GlcNAc:undecaprenyl-phosphate GlcNAc-1-phosphate transferase